MRFIKLIVLAMLVCAFLIPAQAMAQTPLKSVTITGTVYDGGLPSAGARVMLLAWDGQRPGNVVASIMSADGSVAPKGSFTFQNVMFDPAVPISYCIQADKDGKSSYILVHITDAPAGTSQKPKYEKLILDLSKPSWVSDLTVTVQSKDLVFIKDANVTLYNKANETSAPSTVFATGKTGVNGQVSFGAVPYGFYQIKAERNGAIETYNLLVYKQETTAIVPMEDVKLASPTPGPKASTSTPGFEAVFAIAALLGAAYYLRKR